ncbi:hypothetical protein HOY80DRAFT_1037456 [Tuber brumale]|nr:hypothetical protein HOY80DRAFT_1037456 [Tuber brumale]
MAVRTKYIQLGPRPAESDTSNPAITTLKISTQKLVPLTQTVEALFHAFLQEESSKYQKSYKTSSKGREDKIDKAFGIWTARSVRDFESGNACFHKLEVKIDYHPDAVEQYIGTFIGNRYRVVNFTY